MSARLSIAILAAAALLAAPASAPGKGFTYGVSAGEITSSAAMLWSRSDKSGKVKIELSTDGDKRFGEKGDRTLTATAFATNDNTVRVRATKLRSDRVHYYRFSRGKNRSDVGRFTTAPTAGANQPIAFALSGDADATPAPGTTSPFFNNFEVYGAMAKEGNDFNINLGDTIYSDTGVGGGQIPPARTREEKWAKYRQNLALRNLQTVRRSAGLYNHWDDHEFINDFSVPEDGQPLYDAGVQAFRDYSPVTFSVLDGIYRRMRWGRNLELFFLDERSFRSADADEACINPKTGAPDSAPTLPKYMRDRFSQFISEWKEPVSPQCLEAIRSPERTMLGARQLGRFLDQVASSTARTKIVLNQVPVQQLYAFPYDRWEGYEAERQSILRGLAGVKNVVFLSTDSHGNFVNDARLQTLEEGGPVNTGILEGVFGPVATVTFAGKLNAATGNPNAGAAVEGGFFRPPPPDGLGMMCANVNAYSYVQVTVDATQLTLTPKDSTGKPLTEGDGSPCGPFTVKPAR